MARAAEKRRRAQSPIRSTVDTSSGEAERPGEARSRKKAAADSAESSSSGAARRPSKRLRAMPDTRNPPITQFIALDVPHLHMLSQEVLLRVLNQLPVADLLSVSRVSRAWHRLSLDSSLWKALYLTTFARPRSLVTSSQRTPDRPWRELYKISTNWRRGHATRSNRHELTRVVRRSVLPSPDHIEGSSDIEEPGATAKEEGPGGQDRPSDSRQTNTIVQVWKSFYFTARTSDSHRAPVIDVHRSLASGGSEFLGQVASIALNSWLDQRPSFGTVNATEMRLDDVERSGGADEPIRLALFYSTGQWSLFDVVLPLAAANSSAMAFTDLHTSLALSFALPSASYPRRAFSDRLDPLLLARLHSPLLVTCSAAFTLRFYRLHDRSSKTGSRTVEAEELEPTWQSNESWAPVVLSLEKVMGDTADDGKLGAFDEWGMPLAREAQDADDDFKVTLAYSTPVFPASWSVGVQEFRLSIPSSSNRSHIRVRQQHALAMPSGGRRLPFINFGQQQRQAEQLVTSIEYSSPYVITTRSDNTLDVYRVSSSSTSTSLASPPHSSLPRKTSRDSSHLRIEHVRTLFGHTAAVSAVALDSSTGRVVSGGVDGRVKVWDLFAGDSRAGAPAAGGRKRQTVVDVDVDEPEQAPEDGDEGGAEQGQQKSGDVSERGAPRVSIWEEMRELRRAKKRQSRLSGRNRHAATDHGAHEADDDNEGKSGTIKRMWFDEDKIVSLVEGDGDGGQAHVRILRFD